MDGILPNNLLTWDVAGFTVTPPEPDGNNQKHFRACGRPCAGFRSLGVVGSPLRSKRKKRAVAGDQPTLF